MGVLNRELLTQNGTKPIRAIAQQAGVAKHLLYKIHRPKLPVTVLHTLWLYALVQIGFIPTHDDGIRWVSYHDVLLDAPAPPTLAEQGLPRYGSLQWSWDLTDLLVRRISGGQGLLKLGTHMGLGRETVLALQAGCTAFTIRHATAIWQWCQIYDRTISLHDVIGIGLPTMPATRTGPIADRSAWYVVRWGDALAVFNHSTICSATFVSSVPINVWRQQFPTERLPHVMNEQQIKSLLEEVKRTCPKGHI